ncbi:MAG TPA: hypothetical protein VN457_06665, partial [Chlamydiales bacterium]|nr:hypothetical protein [Chlamydiales bacterium]
MSIVSRAAGNREFIEDITHLFLGVHRVTVRVVGYLAGRAVVLLQNLAKIVMSSEALKYAFEGVLEIIGAMQLYIA